MYCGKGGARLSCRDLEDYDSGTICVIDRTLSMRDRECSARRDGKCYPRQSLLC
jgi:hypothetical protein